MDKLIQRNHASWLHVYDSQGVKLSYKDTTTLKPQKSHQGLSLEPRLFNI
jgi:hypothetical protein